MDPVIVEDLLTLRWCEGPRAKDLDLTHTKDLQYRNLNESGCSVPASS